ncbi:MAG: Ig-like domain-containing protein [Gemmataceae bacterium]
MVRQKGRRWLSGMNSLASWLWDQRAPPRQRPCTPLPVELLEDRTTPAFLPPVAVDDAFFWQFGDSGRAAVLANDHAPDSILDPASLAIVSGPLHGDARVRVSNTSAFIDYTSEPGFRGIDTLTYTVRDSEGLTSNEATLTLGVRLVRPVARDDSVSTLSDDDLSIAVLANDSDLDGTLNPASLTTESAPAHGTARVEQQPGQAVILYTPEPGYRGIDTFTYTVQDDEGLVSDEATVTVLSRVPTANPDTVVTYYDDGPVSIDVLANDAGADGPLDPSTLTMVSGPKYGTATVQTTDTGRTVVVYTPEYSGDYTFTYTVRDEFGTVSTPATVTVSVLNPYPVAESDQVQTGEGVPVTIDVLANDSALRSGLNPASLTIVSGPRFGTARVETTGAGHTVIVYSPSSPGSRMDAFAYTVQDNDGITSNEAEVGIIIGNQPPMARPDAVTAWLNTPINIGVLGNDTDPDPYVPPELSGFRPMIVLLPQHGLATRPLTVYQFDDDASPIGNGLASGLAYGRGTTEPGLLAVSGHGDTALVGSHQQSGDYTLYVRLGSFDLTDLDPSEYDYRFDGSLSPGEVDLFDIPGEPWEITAWVDNRVSTGSPDTVLAVVGSGANWVEYVPDPGFVGTDTFTYRALDTWSAQSNEVTVTITVLPNQPPVPIDDTASTVRGTPVDIDVLANDFDPDGTLDPTSIEIVSGPQQGSVELTATSLALDHDSSPLGNGLASALSSVVDHTGHIRLQVNGQQHSGQFALFVRTGANDFAYFDASDFDYRFDATLAQQGHYTADIPGLVPGTPYIAWIDNTVGVGSPDTTLWAYDGPITLRYTSQYGEAGTDTFTYRVKDSHGTASNEATVTVTLDAFNPPPVATPDEAITSQGTEVTIDALANDFDLNGVIEPMTLAVATGPAHGAVEIESGTGWQVFVYTSDPEFVGTDSFTYTVQDNEGLASTPTSVTITVAGPVVNQPPVANPDTATFSPSSLGVMIDVLANDHDSDGTLNPASFAIVSGPSSEFLVVKCVSVMLPNGEEWLQIALECTNPSEFTRVLVVDALGDGDDGNFSPGHLTLREAVRLANEAHFTDTFTYTVADNEGLISDPATVTVTIVPVTTITFAPGLTARGPARLQPSLVADSAEGNSALAITSPIIIHGPAGKNGITLVGPGSRADLRAFVVTAGGNLTLENLTLTHWSTDGSGGAIFVAAGGTATLTNCTLSKNSAILDGGAVHNYGTLTLSGCRLLGNTASGRGGGLYNGGIVSLVDTTFTGNRADSGGGLFINWAGAVKMRGGGLAGNKATHFGGGYYGQFMTVIGAKISGNSAASGGGFYGGGTLTDCVISSNQATTGGGFAAGMDESPFNPKIGLTPGLPIGATLSRCFLVGNRASRGGGFYADTGGIIDLSAGEALVTFADGCIAGNRATWGGGFFVRRGPVILTGSSVSDNRATTGGGACVALGRLEVAGSIFSANTAYGAGGGVFNNGVVFLTTTTLAGNSAATGGGLHNALGTSVVTSCTISNNTARNLGGGLYNEFGSVTLNSSIVADNRRSSRPDDIAARTALDLDHSAFNLIGSGGSGGLAKDVQGNRVGLAPMLAPLGYYGGRVRTMALLPGSPAIDRGTGTDPDARGVGPVGVRDIGAFESQGFVLTVASGSGQSAHVNFPFSRPLTVAVAAVDPAEPVAGGTVTFTAPTWGPGASPSRRTACISRQGTASVTARANVWPGTYAVTVATAGATGGLSFTLTNLGGPRPAAASSLEGDARATMPVVSVTTDATTPPASLTTTPPPVWRDQADYRLDAAARLWRRPVGGRWSVLATGVTWYDIAPNGDLFLLNQRHELKRLRGGYDWYTHDVGVLAATMDAQGTVWEVEAQHNLVAYASYGGYHVLPAIDPDHPPVSEDPPDEFTMLHALGMSRSIAPTESIPPTPGYPFPRELASMGYDTPVIPDLHRPWPSPAWIFRDVEIVRELLVERIDPPRHFPGLGLAQMHYGMWKATVYFTDVSTQARRSQILYLDTYHLHEYVAGTPLPAVLPGVAASAASLIPQTTRAANTVQPGHTVRSLTTAPDGTIYMLGAWYNGNIWVGPDASTLMLWRQLPGSDWQPLFRARSYTMAPDGTLFALDEFHRLRKVPPGSGAPYTMIWSSYPRDQLATDYVHWPVVASGVESYAMAPHGAIVMLTVDHQLKRLLPGSSQWSILASGVRSFAMTPPGTIFALDEAGQLRRLQGNNRWSVLDTGVLSFARTPNGAVYALTAHQQFKKWDGLRWKILAGGVQSLSQALDGTIYALGTDHRLKRLSARDHWTLLDSGVKAFVLAPSAFGNVYVLRDNHELRRLEAGYHWSTLRSDVASILIDSKGVVQARDTQDRLWLVWSDFTAPILPPILPGTVTPICEDPPSDAEILWVANLPLDANVVIVTRNELDEIDSPRDYSDAGPAQMHLCQWSFEIYAADTNQLLRAGYIDLDHLHLSIRESD